MLAFDHKDWMEPYIRLNTERRKKATSDFKKNFFKLMNNSVFGKTMENLRNRTVVKLVRANEGEKLQKLTSHPLYARSAVFGESLAGIQMHKGHILMNRPVYTGMCVLDLSKTLMYEFYYRHLDYKYGSKCQLLYTNTDSLLLEIKTEDVYKDMKNSLFYYDTSDFPKDHPLHSQKKKEDHRKNERQVCRRANLGGCVPALENVLNLAREREKHQESKRHHQGCNKEENTAPAL